MYGDYCKILEVNNGRKTKLWIFISVKIKKTIGGYMKKNECKQAKKYEEKWESAQRYYLKDTVEPP